MPGAPLFPSAATASTQIRRHDGSPDPVCRRPWDAQTCYPGRRQGCDVKPLQSSPYSRCSPPIVALETDLLAVPGPPCCHPLPPPGLVAETRPRAGKVGVVQEAAARPAVWHMTMDVHGRTGHVARPCTRIKGQRPVAAYGLGSKRVAAGAPQAKARCHLGRCCLLGKPWLNVMQVSSPVVPGDPVRPDGRSRSYQREASARHASRRTRSRARASRRRATPTPTLWAAHGAPCIAGVSITGSCTWPRCPHMLAACAWPNFPALLGSASAISKQRPKLGQLFSAPVSPLVTVLVVSGSTWIDVNVSVCTLQKIELPLL